MIITRKYSGSLEEYAQSQKHRYSRKAEYYCYLRTQKAAGDWPKDSKEQAYYLFWMNMHLLYGLMKDTKV